ncbi:MAG: glycosyltransferase, partial [Cyanobacteria bacterium P01_H01_bin.130]
MVANPSPDQYQADQQHAAPLLTVPTGSYTVAADPTVPGEPAASIAPPFLSLIVPTYQEAANVVALLKQLVQLLDQYLLNDYELIVVDDDSPDRTWEYAQGATAQFPQVRVMRRTKERGLSTAVIRGWQVARGQVLGVIDADLQHPPETLIQLLSEIRRGADLAVASRHVVGGGVSDWSLARRVLSRGAQML